MVGAERLIGRLGLGTEPNQDSVGIPPLDRPAGGGIGLQEWDAILGPGFRGWLWLGLDHDHGPDLLPLEVTWIFSLLSLRQVQPMHLTNNGVLSRTGDLLGNP